MGPGVVRQFGIDHATADFILFQDDDDTLMFKDTVATMLSQIKDSNIDRIASISGRIKLLTESVPWDVIIGSV